MNNKTDVYDLVNELEYFIIATIDNHENPFNFIAKETFQKSKYSFINTLKNYIKDVNVHE